jgi:hypothetical protein
MTSGEDLAGFRDALYVCLAGDGSSVRDGEPVAVLGEGSL